VLLNGLVCVVGVWKQCYGKMKIVVFSSLNLFFFSFIKFILSKLTIKCVIGFENFRTLMEMIEMDHIFNNVSQK
jgi:hypothetical protein